MRRSLWLVIPGIAALAAGIAMLLWPFHENGVSGNALRPHYGDFAWFSYSNTLSTEDGQLLRGEPPSPRERVNDRRHAAEGFGVLALLLVGAGVVSARRVRPAGPATPA